MQTAGGKGSSLAKGGMKTKLQAAKIASNAGCRLVLANGRARNIITRIIDGSQVGTLFMPKRKLSNRKRWILNNKPAGTITIDKGALKALKNRKSLLPSGIISVKGNFSADSVVMINDQAKAVTKLNSSQLKQVKGMHSSEIKKQFGKNYRSEPVIPEDIVFLDY
jgi:glutamate 5-kinase